MCIRDRDRTYAKEQLVLKKIVKALEERRFYTIYLGVYGKKNEYQRKKFTFKMCIRDRYNSIQPHITNRNSLNIEYATL